MAVSYKKLFHLLVDRDMTAVQLQQQAVTAQTSPHGSKRTLIYRWSP